MRGDKQKHVAISHLPDNCPPKLAPLERLPKRHRVGPSASLDEYRTNNYFESVSQASSHVNFALGVEIFAFRLLLVFYPDLKISESGTKLLIQ
jgi:hypothetical protein